MKGPAIPLSLGLALAVTGCGGEASPFWAVQHGSLELSNDGFEGYQVWELFSKQWRKDGEEKYHLCVVVQRIEGSLSSTEEGCEGCLGSYTVEVEQLETDCPDGMVDSTSFGGPRAMAVGRVPPSLSDLDPAPGRSMGWYTRWEPGPVEPMGFVIPEGSGSANDQGVQGWVPGERYELEPAYAWEL